MDHPTLRNAPDDALAGARFWMWCGENDISTVDPNRMTCDVMEDDMQPYVENHGGQVDALVKEEGEGVSTDCHSRLDCPAANAMMAC